MSRGDLAVADSWTSAAAGGAAEDIAEDNDREAVLAALASTISYKYRAGTAVAVYITAGTPGALTHTETSIVSSMGYVQIVHVLMVDVQLTTMCD